MSEFVTYQEICRRRNQVCKLRCLASACENEAELHAVLAEVSERVEQQGYERFSLVFHAADDAAPRQGMYAVAMPGATAQEWFLVPIGRTSKGGIAYEACFNRLAIG